MVDASVQRTMTLGALPARFVVKLDDVRSNLRFGFEMWTTCQFRQWSGTNVPDLGSCDRCPCLKDDESGCVAR